jgi:hypothetical protein
MNSPELTSLIQKVQAATEADRDLDAQIAVLLEGGEIVWRTAQGTMELYPVRKYSSTQHVGGVGHAPVPAYTASVDAAFMLIPPGWRVAIMGEWDDPALRAIGAWQVILQRPGEGDNFGGELSPRCDHADSLELALCVAALKAHAVNIN